MFFDWIWVRWEFLAVFLLLLKVSASPSWGAAESRQISTAKWLLEWPSSSFPPLIDLLKDHDPDTRNARRENRNNPVIIAQLPQLPQLHNLKLKPNKLQQQAVGAALQIDHDYRLLRETPASEQGDSGQLLQVSPFSFVVTRKTKTKTKTDTAVCFGRQQLLVLLISYRSAADLGFTCQLQLRPTVRLSKSAKNSRLKGEKKRHDAVTNKGSFRLVDFKIKDLDGDTAVKLARCVRFVSHWRSRLRSRLKFYCHVLTVIVIKGADWVHNVIKYKKTIKINSHINSNNATWKKA